MTDILDDVNMPPETLPVAPPQLLVSQPQTSAQVQAVAQSAMPVFSSATTNLPADASKDSKTVRPFLAAVDNQSLTSQALIVEPLFPARSEFSFSTLACNAPKAAKVNLVFPTRSPMSPGPMRTQKRSHGNPVNLPYARMPKLVDQFKSVSPIARSPLTRSRSTPVLQFKNISLMPVDIGVNFTRGCSLQQQTLAFELRKELMPIDLGIDFNCGSTVQPQTSSSALKNDLNLLDKHTSQQRVTALKSLLLELEARYSRMKGTFFC